MDKSTQIMINTYINFKDRGRNGKSLTHATLFTFLCFCVANRSFYLAQPWAQEIITN